MKFLFIGGKHDGQRVEIPEVEIPEPASRILLQENPQKLKAFTPHEDMEQPEYKIESFKAIPKTIFIYAIEGRIHRILLRLQENH